MGEWTLRILHISDLHEGMPLGSPWRRTRVLGDAFRKNLDELLRDAGHIDLVCFTGDAAWSGKEAEYGRLTKFLREEVLEPLGVPVERFFPVPGNHDIDRDVAQEAWRTLRLCRRPDFCPRCLLRTALQRA